MRFLLVDDNPIKLELLTELLRKELPGCQLKIAADGPGALAFALTEEFDAAFVDVQMPGMDGLEVCRRLKSDSRTRQVPVVLITAHQSTAELRAEGLQAGAFDFITQPIRNVELAARIHSLLRVKQIEDQLRGSNLGLQRQVAEKTAQLRWLSGLLVHEPGGEEATEQSLQQFLAALQTDREPNLTLLEEENFKAFPGGIRRTLLKLGLLEEIPLDIAKTLAEIDQVGDFLQYLVRHNYFVTCAAESPDRYIFRLDLRRFLREQALQGLTEGDREEVFQTATDWCLHHHLIPMALGYALQSQEPAMAESICAEYAGELLWLDKLPDQLFREVGDSSSTGPWLRLFISLGCQQRKPEHCLRGLMQLRQEFRQQQDQIGALLSVALCLEHCLLIDSQPEASVELLAELRPLVVDSNLGPVSLIGQRAGLIYLLSTLLLKGPKALTTARSEISILEISTDAPARLLSAASLLHCFDAYYSGALLGLARELGRCFYSAGQKFSCHEAYRWLLRGYYLLCRGETQSVLQVCGDLRGQLDGFNLGAHAIGQLTCLLEGLAIQSLKGSRAALNVLPSNVDKNRDFGWAGTKLQLVIALVRQQVDSAESVEQMVPAVASHGLPPLPRLENKLLLGILKVKSRPSEATGLLQEAVSEATEIGCLVHQLTAQAYLSLAGSDNSGAVERNLVLGYLQDQKLRQLPFFTPPVVEALCLKGVLAGEQQAWCQATLAQRGLRFDGEGGLRPNLQFFVLGPLDVGFANGPRLAQENFSQALRQLLGVLVMAPGQQVSLEQVQECLWPGSDPKRVRSKLDSLLHRLRGCFDPVLGEGTARGHLLLQNGLLSLVGCFLDIEIFQQQAREGLRYARRQERWRASLALQRALDLWRGSFGLGFPREGEAAYWVSDLQLLLADSSLALARIYQERQEWRRAEEALRCGWRQDPLNEDLAAELCHLFRQSGQPLRQTQFLNEYRTTLRGLDFTPEEIESAIAELTLG